MPKNLGASPGFAGAADSLREAQSDRATAGDPNAMGPVARSVPVPTASHASGLCDDHDSDMFKLPTSSNGFMPWGGSGDYEKR